MLIGIDDTDSPLRMCTTYIGTALARELRSASFYVKRLFLIRLNPNIPYKTRGNAAVALDVEGDPELAFRIACGVVERMADFEAENTHPGVVVTKERPPAEFYERVVKDICELGEAIEILEGAGALYKGYKNGRGLIGATAAVCSQLEDHTFEILVYRKEENLGTPRRLDRGSFFLADAATYPHTWDTVDRANDLVVCAPHTPDPVLFGIRGESPFWVAYARAFVQSEEAGFEQIFCTNQGTDAHLIDSPGAVLQENRSYLLEGLVASAPKTEPGGHVWFALKRHGITIRCMAYEPTKNFREIVRLLIPGDSVKVAGSFKKGSINLEKMKVLAVSRVCQMRPPVCAICNRRMTSAGKGKGYKCRTCRSRSMEAEIVEVSRKLEPCWKETPPCARRHIAMPLVRLREVECPSEGARDR
ncbi:MAG: tRNA(Ile)(2)-agmatinylcytidine synthase [Methanomicrobiales archaeon]|nr:tRNA(Ile)(2)-agmatinylcytidine synthase [Methanomicrobiales archaeon]